MAMFHSDPHRATSATHIWFCVVTPSVFREYKLPACSRDWSRADKRRFAELEHLAEVHGTHIERHSYRRG